jgi:Cupin
MPKLPEDMTDPPAPQEASVPLFLDTTGTDVLADVLDSLKLKGRIFCRCELSAPWAVGDRVCRGRLLAFPHHRKGHPLVAPLTANAT